MEIINKILKIINLDRNNCYITNLIIWKPPIEIQLMMDRIMFTYNKKTYSVDKS